MRICRTCNQNKRITYFARNGRSMGGRLTECKECNKIYRKKHAKQRVEVEMARRRRLGVKPKKIYTTIEEQRIAHIKACRKWQKKNMQKVSKTRKRWYKRNPGYHAFTSSRRRLIETKQTPSWADLKAIQKIYDLSKQFTEGTGIQHEVDHYYPLRGKTVSGLHVPENLQIITRKENHKKLNKHPDDFYS